VQNHHAVKSDNL